MYYQHEAGLLFSADLSHAPDDRRRPRDAHRVPRGAGQRAQRYAGGALPGIKALFPKRGLYVEQVKGPDSFALVCAMVDEHHRHHDEPLTWMWGLLAWRDGWLVGVASVGLPKSRVLMERGLLEVNRLCTFTRRRYGAASEMYRVASMLSGKQPCITYTLQTEQGVSLVEAGWVSEGPAGGGSWSCPSRPRIDHHPLERKTRWCDRPRAL